MAAAVGKQTIPPNTVTMTSHALTIHSTTQGSMIGAINSWNPKQTLGIVGVYEFGNVSNGDFGSETGMPYEKVPGNVGGMTIDVNRYDIYTRRMEDAFGSADLTILSNDPNAFAVREIWLSPDSTSNYTLIYEGCRFSRIGRTLTTTDDRIVKVNATLEYTRVRKITA